MYERRLSRSTRDVPLHSFRVGTVEALAIRFCIPDRNIQREGRWKSEAFKAYVRMWGPGEFENGVKRSAYYGGT